MGIQGLYSFIRHRSDKFWRDYELCNTQLVIDGNSILCFLYKSSNCNYCFGGDYMKYASYVAEFFDELLTCKVSPIVIIDGAKEDKKWQTIFARYKRRIQAAATSTVHNEKDVIPLLTYYAFISIARQRNIPLLVSTFEADDHISSIARILNCPVLSCDSDFYIYDVTFIPYDTLKPGFHMTSNRFVKRCKVFDRENFLTEFSLDKKLLPLAASILGNDYIKISVFHKFFRSLKVAPEIVQKYSSYNVHFRIAAVFSWLQNHSLDSAVSKIISKIDPEDQQKVLKILEMIINGYLNPLPDLLDSLDYSQEKICLLMQNFNTAPYKFQSHSSFETNKCEDDNYENDFGFDKIKNYYFSSKDYQIVKPGFEDDLKKVVPSWFLSSYNRGSYPSYFLDMLNRQHIMVLEQMEDISQPPAVTISLKIISVIFRLLTKGTIVNTNILKYTARGNKGDILTYQLDCQEYTFDYEIPKLEQLVDFPLVSRRQIFLKTIGVLEKSLLEFPPKWRLYIAAIKYWHSSAETTFTTIYHLYALIMLIVLHVVRETLQCQKNVKNHNINKDFVDYKQQDNIGMNKSMNDALSDVTGDNCFWADEFFKSKMYIDRSHFDISVIHAFSLFQNCLRYTMDLNSLLGCPYVRINVADFYSGTLIYNLFTDLRGHKNIKKHIRDVFEKSQSILRLFISLSAEIENMLRK